MKKRTKIKSRKSTVGKTRANNRPSLDWVDIDQKKKVFLKIMREIVADPSLGDDYRKSDAAARQAFNDKGMQVPDDVKVVFLPSGDGDKQAGASAVIELPKKNLTNPSDDQLLELMVANYHIVW
jgi:hypothetical protein